MGRIRSLARWVGIPIAVVSVIVLVRTVEIEALARTWASLVRDPAGIIVALGTYSLAFILRSWVWQRLVPGLGWAHAWAAIHLSLAANHLLPLRLGEAVRPMSAAKRTAASLAATTASTVAMRSADVLAVAGLALLLAPSLAFELAGAWTPVLLSVVGIAWLAGLRWLRRIDRSTAPPGTSALVLVSAICGWLLESVMMMQAASWAGLEISYLDSVLVTAVTIAAQIFAVAPGGLGTYEAAGTAALVGLGASAGPALAAALSAHALKTAYSFITGAVAAFAPAPGAFGRFRLAPPSTRAAIATERASQLAPVVLFLPAYNEEATVGDVVRRTPTTVAGRPVKVIVIDDGSEDGTARAATTAGADVVSLGVNSGLGAAVREGLRASLRFDPACVAFCDADGEYAPEELPVLARPILDGEADYVVGSRFAGDIRRMLPHRRLGNTVLTKLLSLVARRKISDGQSGYRALSPAAARAAEVIHDYNYAQVLTLDLLGKGFSYSEVPIGYGFRTSGRSFVRLGRYLRHVLPAVHREVNNKSEGFA